MITDQLKHILNQEAINYLSMALPLVLLLIGMFAAVSQDSYISRRRKIIFCHIIVLAFLLIIENIMSEILLAGHQSVLLRTANSVLGYSIRPMILVLFLAIVNPDRNYLSEWLLAGANTVLYLTAFFSPITFYYIDGAWVAGPLRNACLVVSVFLLGELAYLTVRKYRGIRKREMFMPILCLLMIVCSLFLDYSTGYEGQLVSFLTIAVVVSSMFYYIWLHLQFVREHERDLQAEQRIQIMMTQIQPHFLFNALNTIRALYAKDPPLADRTMENFSTYLRQNLDSLNRTDLIPFSKELQHVRLYAEIEALRFPQVHIEYQISDSDFGIPALTIQPLVENAIRHGVRKQKNGLITISAVHEDGVHRVTVRDNGIGFDPKEQPASDESHIGIENVKHRVELMCGGTMLLSSKIGEGTSVTLLIPEIIETGKAGRRK